MPNLIVGCLQVTFSNEGEKRQVICFNGFRYGHVWSIGWSKSALYLEYIIWQLVKKPFGARMVTFFSL